MTLTRWFRRNQKYLLAAVVVMLMLAWGILTPLSQLARRRGAEGTIRGRSVEIADMQAAQGVLRLGSALGLFEPMTAVYMQYGGASRTATMRVAALGSALRRFVLRGEEPSIDADAAWRYLVLLYAAEDAGVVATQGEVVEVLTSLPILSGPDGFVAERYRALLQSTGMTDMTVTRWIGQLVKIAKLIEIRREATVASDAEVWMDWAFRNERARIRFVTVDAELFEPLVEPSEEELVQFYQDHRDRLPEESVDGVGYMADERVRAEIALVKLSDMREKVEVSGAEIEVYYEQHREDYRRSHEGNGEAEGKTDAPDAEPQYRPLGEVRDDIAGLLREQKASELAQQLAERLMADLEEVRENYENMPLPLEQMARRHGLEYGVLRTPSGRELLSEEELAAAVPDGEQIAQFAFGGPESLYYPDVSQTSKGPAVLQVLEWREPEPREFEEVRELVRRDYVKLRALEHAREFARRLQLRANEVGLTHAVDETKGSLSALLDLGSEDLLRVQESGLFDRDALSIEGLPGAAPEELVRTAFMLEKGDVGLAVSETSAARCFVLQTIERKPAPRDQFASALGSARGFYLMRKQGRMVEAWLDRLLSEVSRGPVQQD